MKMVCLMFQRDREIESSIMGDSSGRLSPKKSSIDDIINHITADLQSYDGQYIVLGQPSQNQSNQSHLWQSTSSEMPPIQQPPIYKQQQQQQAQQHSMYYNTAPGHDNYMSYGNMQQHYQNSYLQHHQQQPYQHPPPPQQQSIMRDYGLFANHNDQMMSSHNNTYPGHQLIDNLVGNWVPNQSGTYSPFGNSFSAPNTFSVEKEERPAAVFSDMPRQESLLSNNNVGKKPRMVAEVKPMRPSYSAVLTKSPPLPTQSNKSNNKITPPVSVKGENASKSKSGKGKKAEADAKVSSHEIVLSGKMSQLFVSARPRVRFPHGVNFILNILSFSLRFREDKTLAITVPKAKREGRHIF
jgi:hypothetical protein